MKTLALMASILTATALPAAAQDVRITTFKSESTFTLNGQTYTISRSQDTNATLQGDFARIARPCPGDCIQPMSAGVGVVTFGELEVIKFLENIGSEGKGLLIDARLPDAFGQGNIPGSVNVPSLTLDDTNRYRADILRALGAVDGPDGTFTFDGAMALVVYCGGPWSGDASHLISNLLDAGYPPEKLSYYRAGMQGWHQLGLTVAQSQNPG